MAWLMRDGEVLASLEVAASLGARLRGLLGLDDFEGALLLPRARSVHTIGMRFPIDVAYCSRQLESRSLEVQACASMKTYRLGMPRPRAGCVIEARRGAFERWSLRPGDVLEIKG